MRHHRQFALGRDFSWHACCVCSTTARSPTETQDGPGRGQRLVFLIVEATSLTLGAPLRQVGRKSPRPGTGGVPAAFWAAGTLLSGGAATSFPATMPVEQDFLHPETKALPDKENLRYPGISLENHPGPFRCIRGLFHSSPHELWQDAEKKRESQPRSRSNANKEEDS